MLIYIGLGLGLLYLLASTAYNLYRKDSSIPGPFLTSITRLWYFAKVHTGSFHLENIMLHRRYGPVVRVAPGYYSILEADKTVYGIGSKFPKGDWYQGWKHPSPDRWTMFPDQDIKRHAETRKRFQSLYSMSSLVSYETYVDECIDIILARFSQFAQRGQTIDLSHWFQCYAFDVMGHITYSKRFGFLDAGEDIAGTIRALDKSMVYSTLIGIYPKLHPLLFAIMEKFPGSGAAGRNYLMRFVQQKIDERNAASLIKDTTGSYGRDTAPSQEAEDSSIDTSHGAPQDFLEKMTLAHHRDPSKVTPYHIFMMGLSNIIAGSDTTAVSLSSILYHLITNPSALNNLRREILSVTNVDEPDNPGRISFSTAQNLPYLQAVIKEALRLHPATGLPLWRVVPPGGAEVCGHWFPEGTNVGVNSWVVHYDQANFGSDAASFRPERWLSVEGEGSADAEARAKMERAWMPVCRDFTSHSFVSSPCSLHLMIPNGWTLLLC